MLIPVKHMSDIRIEFPLSISEPCHQDLAFEGGMDYVGNNKGG